MLALKFTTLKLLFNQILKKKLIFEKKILLDFVSLSKDKIPLPFILHYEFKKKGISLILL